MPGIEGLPGIDGWPGIDAWPGIEGLPGNEGLPRRGFDLTMRSSRFPALPTVAGDSLIHTVL